MPTHPPPGLSAYPDMARDNYPLPGTTVPSRFIASPQEKLSSGKIPSAAVTSIPAVPPHLPGVNQQAKPAGLHSPRSTGSLMTSSATNKSRSAADAYTLPGSADPVLPNTGPVVKKVRKRRRVGTDSSSGTPNFKSSCNANPVPGVGVLSAPSSVTSNATPVKHSRMENSSVPHGSLHRSTFGGVSNTVASTVNSFAIASSVSSSLTAISAISHSGTNASTSSSGKSVYDFDDNPNSLFDMPSLPQNNSISATYQSSSTSSLTKLTNPSSTYVSGAPSSTVHPPNLGLSSALGSSSVGPVTERTVERKASLKVTIKTLPPQKPHQSKATELIGGGNKLSSPEIKSKHVTSVATVPGLKKRKRRSIEGKPSSYMLQMLQPPTSTNTNTVHSATPMTGLKLAKPNAALSHANSIVKKERKRRMTHMMTDRVNSMPTSTLGPAVASVGESALSTNACPDLPGKPGKFDRSHEAGAERSRVKSSQINSTSISDRVGSSSGTVVLPNSSGSGIVHRKKITSSSPLSGTMTIGDEGQSVKRQNLAAGAMLPHSDSGDLKRRKHSDISRHATSSSMLNLSGSSVSESEEGQSASSTACDSAVSTNSGTLKHITKSTSSFGVGNSSLSTGRTGTGTSSNAPSKLSTGPSYSMSSQGSALSTSSGLGTPGGPGGATVGLIKGYKIPKKKNNQSNPVHGVPGMAKPDTGASNPIASLISSDVGPQKLSGKSMSTDSSDHTGYLSGQNLSNCPTSQTPAVSYSSAHSVYSVRSDSTSVIISSQAHQQQATATVTGTTVSATTVTTTTVSSTNTPAALPASQPRRRISDIVDKLRAKSSSSGPSGSSSASGSSADVPMTTDGDRSNSSGEPFEMSAVDSSSGQPDQRGDNIFEKFSSR